MCEKCLKADPVVVTLKLTIADVKLLRYLCKHLVSTSKLFPEGMGRPHVADCERLSREMKEQVNRQVSSLDVQTEEAGGPE